jgi:hypothetical protein
VKSDRVHDADDIVRDKALTAPATSYFAQHNVENHDRSCSRPGRCSTDCSTYAFGDALAAWGDELLVGATFAIAPSWVRVMRAYRLHRVVCSVARAGTFVRRGCCRRRRAWARQR